MKCEQAVQQVQERLEAPLLPLDDAALSAHLRNCECCRRDEARFRALVHGLRALPQDARVPENFTSSVMSALPEMLPAQSGAGHLARWGLAAAAALAAFVLGLALLPAAGGPDVAHDTLAPLSASLRLDGALAGEAVAALARVLDATAAELAAASLASKVAFAALFAATLAGMAFLVHGWRAEAPELVPALRGRRA